MASTPFRFSLCADDYAISPAVSRGIIEALDAGVLSATSVMTTSPTWPESAAALKPHAARADIGLHLNLTMGAPLGPMPKLAPGGVFPAIDRFLPTRGTLPLEEIDAEIGRQLDAFETAFGASPTHLDGHQHVHAMPQIRALVRRHLDRRRLCGRIWLRDSADRLPRILQRRTCLKKALGLAWITRGFAADAAPYPTNTGFAGFSNFRSDDDFSACFKRFLVAPGPRHLVMCHPGYVDDALRALDPVTDSREQELAFLLSPAFRATLAENNAGLGRLSASCFDVNEMSIISSS